jgi:hypothetical protein
MRTLSPIGYFILYSLILIFASSFELISESLNSSLLILALLWTLISLSFEIIHLFNKSDSFTKKIKVSRKISVALLIIPGLCIFFTTFISAVSAIIGIVNSPNLGYAPLFLPILIPPVIFISVSIGLIILVAVKTKHHFTSKSKV